MDTTAVIVVLFVVTILSSLGSKGYHQPATAPVQEQVITTRIPTAELPAAGYPHDEGFSPKRPILQLVGKYRNPDEAEEIANNIMKYAQIYDVNPKLVASLMARESRFNPRATSSSGAKGLGQLMPSTCQSTGVTDPYDIEQNAMGTTRYLKYLLDRFQKSGQQVSFAVAGYLEGPNLVDRQQNYSPHAAAYINDILETYSKL